MPSTLLENTEQPTPTSAPVSKGILAFLDSWRGIIILLAVASVSLLYLRDMRQRNNLADLIPVWVGSRTILAGQNPYSASATQEIQHLYYGGVLKPDSPKNPMSFAYPVPTAILFWPLAKIASWPAVELVFLWAAIPLSAASVLCWLEVVGFAGSTREKLIVTALALSSWPFVWAIGLLQPTVIVAGLLALGSLLLTRCRYLSAGVCFAFSLVKPQIGIPVVAWLLFWSITQRRWKFTASLTATIVILLIAAQWLLHGWFTLWLSALTDFASYRHLDPVMGKVGSVLAVLAVACLLIWKRRHSIETDPQFAEALALVLAAAVVIMPTEPLMLYNNVLLLPAVLLLVQERKHTPVAGGATALALIMWQLSYATILIAVIAFAVSSIGILSVLPFYVPLLPPCTLLALWLVIYEWKVYEPPLLAGVITVMEKA